MPEHETCARTAQPQDSSSDLFRFAEATDWFGRHEGSDDIRVVVLCDPCRHRCVADDAWAHRVDSDTGVCVVEGRSAREADDTEFAGRVGCAPFRTPHPANRGTVDDCSASLRNHLSGLGLHAFPYPARGDVQDAVELLVIGFEHRCAIAVYARVVERRIEPAISFDGLLGHRPDLVSVPDVTGHREDLMAR